MGRASERGHAVPGPAGQDPLAVGNTEAAGALASLLLGLFFLDMAGGEGSL